MENNTHLSPKWKGFRFIWMIIAFLLFLLLLLLLLLGRSPWGNSKCAAQPTVVEKQTLVDNPDLLARIGVLEKENTQIAGLKTNIADLTKSAGLVPGLQAKIKALEGVDLNFENPELMGKIKMLETENASIDDLKKRIIELEANNAKSADDKTAALNQKITDLQAENGMIAGLKGKIETLEADDKTSQLTQKINNLEISTLRIPTLEARIKTLQSENSMIAGLKGKIETLEGGDKTSELMQKINNLEVSTLKIPTLESRIGDLKAENDTIPSLKARIKELESMEKPAMSKPVMAVPNVAKLYFDSGSSRFPSDATESLSDVVSFLRENPGSSASLVGFHDAAGSTNWNRRLANKRSNRVKQILLEAGIANSRIIVEQPSQTLGTGAPEEARRVEVKVSK